MRIGMFGGSFDPPHVGHLLLAQDVRDALALDRLLVVPVATQPLKSDGRTSPEHRLAMVRRCFDGVTGIQVDPIEIDRGGLSFTVDTVEAFRRRWPLAEFHLLIGDDVLATLPRWREPERLLTLVRLVVMHRELDGERSTTSPPDLSAGLPVAEAIHEALQAGHRLATRRIDVTSTEIRARVRAGRSIRGFVPVPVEDYIASAGLYVRVSTGTDVSERA